MSRHSLVFAWAVVLLLIVTGSAAAQTPTPTPTPAAANTPETTDIEMKSFERLEWRNIGPAYMSGRVADVEGVPGNPDVVYVASASGGLWKTMNAGVTWSPIFER